MSKLRFLQTTFPWDAATEFKTGDPAFAGDNLYRAKIDNVNVDPLTDINEATWELIGAATVTNSRKLFDALLPVKTGLTVAGIGGTLTLSSTSGTILQRGGYEINETVYTTQALVTFDVYNQTGLELAAQTVVPATQYDNGGVVTDIPANNDAQIWRLYAHTDTPDTFALLRGQQWYNNLNAAVDELESEVTIVPAGLANYKEIARFVARKNITDFSNANHFQIRQTDKFFEIGSSTADAAVMVGADGTNAGEQGEVPAPAAADNFNYLRGDASWGTPELFQHRFDPECWRPEPRSGWS